MEKDQKPNIAPQQASPTANAAVPAKAPFAPRPFGDNRGGGQAKFFSRDPKRNPRRGGGGRGERVKSEFDQKIISIRRVTRVASGGRRFSFSVALVAGNRKGSVGVGIGKAGDTSLAIDKAMKNAKKHLVKLNLTKNMSIPYDVDAKYCSARVKIMPAKGRGVSAGSSVRNVIELAGINDVTAKIFSRSKNKLNNARVAIKALSTLSRKALITPAATAAPVAAR